MKKYTLSHFLAFIKNIYPKKWNVFLLSLFFFCLLGGVSQSQAVDSSPLAAPEKPIAHLVAKKTFAGKGEPLKLFVQMELSPGWHTYWQYPGEVGLPPRFEWELFEKGKEPLLLEEKKGSSEGWQISKPIYSLPSKFEEQGLTTFGYQQEALFSFELTPPATWGGKTPLTLKLHFSWLACKQLCLPGSQDLTISLGEGEQQPEPETAKLLQQIDQYEQNVGWPQQSFFNNSLKVTQEREHQVLSFQGEPGYQYQFFPDPPKGVNVGDIALEQHGDQWKIVVPWSVSESQDIAASSNLKSDFNRTLSGLLVGEKVGGKAGKQEVKERHGWRIPPHAADEITPHQEGQVEGNSLSWLAIVIALGSGLLGGLILNVMPCVLPVISLKIFGFIHQAGSSREKILRHALAFISGIYSWFLGMGVLVLLLKSAGKQVSWAFQFQNSSFIFLLLLFIFLFALNLFGVFEVMLPGRWNSQLEQMGSETGYRGSFFQGLFATLLATPCTAPFLGSALGVAFTQGSLLLLGIFVAIATGMALPYFLLALQPDWLKLLPRPGAWMESVKQAMGFPLLATVGWLLTVLGSQQGVSTIYRVAILLWIVALLAWGYGLLTKKKRGWLGTFFQVFLVVVLCGVIYNGLTYLHVPQKPSSSATLVETANKEDQIEWVDYSEEKLEELRAAGKPVFLEATAAWCLTCQFNEKRVIETEAVREALKQHHIVAMRADWTNSDPTITKLLRRFGRAGVPLYVFFPAPINQVAQPPQVLSELLEKKRLLTLLTT